jgi:hypothetical protein
MRREVYEEDHEDEESIAKRAKQLHRAFASLVAGTSDPFDAVGGAGEHLNAWKKVRGDVDDIGVHTGLDEVAAAGLARIGAAVEAGKNVFEEYDGRPGVPIWRWRDLLEYSGGDYSAIRDYLRRILAADNRYLPDLLGMLAGWSGDDPGLRERNYAEIRDSAETIFGWCQLLRLVAQYRRNPPLIERKHVKLVKQFECVVADRAEIRRQQQRQGKAGFRGNSSIIHSGDENSDEALM